MAGALSDSKPTEGTGQPPTDRRTKIALLTASGLTFGFLIAAMYRENFQSQWRQVQREYRTMLLQSSDERQRQLGQAFQIELRQVDLPQLRTTDRCVTCHVGLDNPGMAGAPLPFRVHSGNFLKHHPVEKYGCTICHQGQGLATNFREATATDVFWDYPLLPVRLTEASCGVCHAADSPLMAKHAPRLVLGHQLFLDRGCQSCHKLGGVGGQLGPALDGEGLKIKHQLPMAHVKGEHTLANWLKQHFDNPQQVVANSQMRPPRLSAAETEALTIYMLSLRGRDLPQNYIAGDRVASWDAELHRKTKDPTVLYNRFCVSCHGDGTFGQWDKFFLRFNPAIRGPGLGAMADKEYLRAAVERGRPGTLMPAWGKNAGGLTPEQVASLVDYLANGDQRPPQTLRPIPDTLTGGNSGRGSELFTQYCSACHAGGKMAPNLVLQRQVEQGSTTQAPVAAGFSLRRCGGWPGRRLPQAKACGYSALRLTRSLNIAL